MTKHTEQFIHLTMTHGGEVAMLPGIIAAIIENKDGTSVQFKDKGGGCYVKETKAEILKLMAEKEQEHGEAEPGTTTH